MLWGKNNKLYGRDGKLLTASIEIPSYDPVLENNTWAQIQSGLRAGNPMGWKVGDTKSVTLTDGNTYTARLVDLNKGRYKDTSNTDNVAVFEFVELLKDTTTYMNLSRKTYKGINSFTVGGWPNSDLRISLNGNGIYKGCITAFPDDLTSVMLSVKVWSAEWSCLDIIDNRDIASFNDIVYSDSDKLFVGAYSEFFNASNDPDIYIGENILYPQWDYYKVNDTNNARIKKQLDSTDSCWYWNRSPNYWGTGFTVVLKDGTSDASGSNEYGALSPVFVL